MIAFINTVEFDIDVLLFLLNLYKSLFCSLQNSGTH